MGQDSDLDESLEEEWDKVQELQQVDKDESSALGGGYQNSIQRGIDVYRKNNIVSKTYLKQKAHNYQKKRSGTGGGFVKQIDNFSQVHAKRSYNTIREQLKQQVLQDKIDFQHLNKYRQRGKWEFL